MSRSQRNHCLTLLFAATFGVLNFSQAEQGSKQSLLVIPSAIPAPINDAVGHPLEGATLDNFLVLDSAAAPKEVTRLKISYDNAHLYISGEATSFALDPASNMDDSFAAKATERDGKVTSDDSVEIRIKNKNGESYSIAINSLGAIQDMRYDSHQDQSWNGEITVKAEREEGRWRFRMAIELASVGLSDLAEGETILFNAFRRDSLSGELSLVDPDMMTLVFGGSSAFAQVPHFEQPLSSATMIPLTVVNAEGQHLAWKRETLQNDKVITGEGGSLIATDDRSVLETISSSKNAPLARRERISVYASGHLIYRSPEFPFQDNRSEVRISAKADVPFTLAWNGKPLSTGKQSVEGVVAGLGYGVNELTVQMASGHPPEVKIMGPGNLPLTVGDAWEEIPSPGDETVFRKTIAYQATSLSPHFPDGLCELAAGSAQFFHWDGGKLKEWTHEAPLHDFRLIIEVPEGLHFLGASGYRPPETAATEAGLRPLPQGAEYTWVKRGDVKHGEVKYARYAISRNLPVVLTSKKETWLEGVERRQKGMVFAVQSDPTKDSGTLPPMYYGMEANGQTVVEVPNLMTFQAGPPLDGKMPKQIILSLYTRLGLIRDPKLLEMYFDTLTSAGINEILGETASSYPREIGLRQSSFFALSESSRVGFGMGTVMVDEILNATPEAQAITFGGEKRLTPCLAWLAEHEEAWPVIDKEIAGIARRNPSMSQLFWDYEFPPFPEGVDAYPMFSEFGIKTFKNTYKIDEKLTPEVIREKYADEWVAFTCGEIARVADRLQKAAAKHGMGMTMYSGYQLPYTQRRYNVDWKKLGPHLDRAYCGYSGDQTLIDGTQDALGNTPLIGSLLAQGPSSPSRSVATIVRTMIAHRGGVLFWYEGGGESTRTLAPIAKASRFASAYEPFILEGQRQEDFLKISDHDKDGVFALRRGAQILLVLLNEGDSSRQFNFKLPEGIVVGAGEDRPMKGANAINETVEAGGVRSVLLDKKVEENSGENM